MVAQAETKQAESVKNGLTDKLPIFSYANAKEEIVDTSKTFDQLRNEKAEDFPELDDGTSVSWKMVYGTITKNVANPKKTTISSMKKEIENSKAFLDSLKKAKGEIECKVTPTVTAKKKGVASAYKGMCTSVTEAIMSNNVISFIPSSDGRVYELRKNKIGAFIAPADHVSVLGKVRAGFIPALPKMPNKLLEQAITFFRSFMSEDGDYEAIVYIYWSVEDSKYYIFVPKQQVSGTTIDTTVPELDEEKYILAMEIHSHNHMAAEFSVTDNKDEKVTRLYTVVPQDALTYDFAAGFMMKLMGYYPEMDNSLRTEALGKLVKGVSRNDDGTVSLNGVYTMMYAATKINCYHLETVNGKPGYVLRDGRTILSYNKDIYMIKGKVNAMQYASLTGAKAAEGELVINSDKFKYDDPSYEMLIGKTVTGYAYIKEGEEAKALYLEVMENRSGDTVIEGEKFVSYSGNQITYETENGQNKVQTVKNPVIIYNGKQLESGEYSDEIFDIVDGDITLVKNDGNVNVIIINKYKNIIVGAVDAEKKTIYDLIYPGVTLNLDIDKAFIKSVNGSDVEVANLRSGSVLTYAQSMDGEYVVGITGGSALTTQISSKNTGDDVSVTISGREYPFTAEAKDSINSIILGVEYTFYINVNGRVAAVKGTSSVSGEMAYMIKAYSDQEDNDKVKIRVMKSDAIDNGDAIWLVCRNKVKVDGETFKYNKIIDALKKFNGTAEIPIVYTLGEDGLVSQIDTPFYNEYKEDTNTLRIRHSGETDGQVYSKTAVSFGYRDLFDGKYLMDLDGMCIQRKSDSEIIIAEKIRNDSHLKMDLYGIGAISPMVCFAVVNDASLAQPELEDIMAVVQGVYQGINKDNDIVTYLTLVVKGEAKDYEILAENEATIAAKVDDGDLIRYAVDMKDRITNVEVILDYSDRNASVGYQNYTFHNNNDYRIVVGKIYDVYKTNNAKAGSNNNILQFITDMNNIENSLETTFTRGGLVYRYSIEGVKRGKHVEMTELNTAEIKTYMSVGNDADIMVLVSEFNIPLSTYIVSSND